MTLPPVPEEPAPEKNDFDTSLSTTILLEFYGFDPSVDGKRKKRVALLQSKYTGKSALNQILANSVPSNTGVVIQCESFRSKTGKAL
jgi:hypothetical protein